MRSYQFYGWSFWTSPSVFCNRLFDQACWCRTVHPLCHPCNCAWIAARYICLEEILNQIIWRECAWNMEFLFWKFEGDFHFAVYFVQIAFYWPSIDKNICYKRECIFQFGKLICLGPKICQMACTEFRILSFEPPISSLYVLDRV